MLVLITAFPYWENKPEDVNVVINDSGELDCQVAGVPLPAVTWLINGVPSGEAGMLTSLLDSNQTSLLIY